MTLREISELVRLAQAGDRAAYGKLVEHFHSDTHAQALSVLRNLGEAQELAQEVFIHAMTKLRQLRDPTCFAGWLRRITKRMALNRLTRRGPVYGAESELLDNLRASGSDPLDDLLQREARRELWDGLNRLKPLDRETLVGFYFHGRSLQQLSQQFQVPIGTIKRRLHVARNRLRAHLQAGTSRRKVRRRELACV